MSVPIGRCRRVVAAASFATVVAFTTSGAQPTPTRSMIAVSPLIPIPILTVEFERVIQGPVTGGVVASYIDIEDDRLASADLKLRYYPKEIPLRGLSVGLTAGVTSFDIVPFEEEPDFGFPDPNPPGRERITSPTIGILTDYNWVFGARQRFTLGTGLGLKRLLTSREDRERVESESVLATLRLVLGWQF